MKLFLKREQSFAINGLKPQKAPHFSWALLFRAVNPLNQRGLGGLGHLFGRYIGGQFNHL